MENTFTLQVDIENKIKVKSSIIYADWLYNAAHAGGIVEFEVGTSMVGEGAPIEITARTSAGKKIGSTKGEINRNYFRGFIDIPEKMKYDDTIFFEAKLPKHKHSIESNEIPVYPKIRIKKMQWDKTHCQRDEVLRMICEFEPECIGPNQEATVVIKEYDSDNNHDIIAKIPTIISNYKMDMEWVFKYVDDIDDIPTQAELEKYGKNYSAPEYFFVVYIDGIGAGEGQESGLVRFRDNAILEYTDSEEMPVPGARFKAILADGKVIEGTLSDDGTYELEGVNPGTVDVEYYD